METKTESFRVVYTYRGPHYPGGWHQEHVGTYSTLEEACEVAMKKFPAGVAKAVVDQAVVEGDSRRWRRRASRARKQVLVAGK